MALNRLGPHFFIKRDVVGNFQDDWVKVLLMDTSTNAPITGATFPGGASPVTIWFVRPENRTLVEKIGVAADWEELGNGIYALRFTATDLGNLPGNFIFYVSHANGTCYDQIWLGGGNVAGQIATVFDPNLSNVTFLLWLEAEGQVVKHLSTPAVEFWVIDAADGVALDKFNPFTDPTDGTLTQYNGYVSKIVVPDPGLAANKLYWAYAIFTLQTGTPNITRVLHKPFFTIG